MAITINSLIITTKKTIKDCKELLKENKKLEKNGTKKFLTTKQEKELKESLKILEGQLVELKKRKEG